MDEYGQQNMQCGNKDMLSMDNSSADPGAEMTRRQKGCDNLSEYSAMARRGGHKGLLSMEGDEPTIETMDDYGRRQKSCANISEYSSLALQGGHKDLLKIKETDAPTDQKNKPHAATRTYGDWYMDEVKPDGTETNGTVAGMQQTPTRDYRKGNGNCIVPGEEEETPSKMGKKMFNHSFKRQEAPFATNY